MKPDEAARKFLASERWQAHERNYLTDFKIGKRLQEALDDVLVTVFMAGWNAAQERDEARAALAKLQLELAQRDLDDAVTMGCGPAEIERARQALTALKNS